MHRKITVIVLAVLLLIVLPFSALGQQDWAISISKTADREFLDEDYRAKVTLSLPAGEEVLVSDIVFVLDKSTSADVEEEIINLLDTLKKHVEDTDAKVKAGVVIFNRQANVTCELTDIETGYEAITEGIKADISSGTNTHAGLLAGKKMLDEDTEVSAERKYLIFISDTITYIFNESPTAIPSQFSENAVFAGPDAWANKYGDNNPPEDWEEYLAAVSEQIAQDNGEFDVSYGEQEPFVPYAERLEHAMTVDRALYETAKVYKSAQEAGYSCYALTADTTSGTPSQYLWGPSFMEHLAQGRSVSFDGIYRDVIYLLDAGSTVIDIIGQGESFEKDGSLVEKAYDFRFISSAEELKLTVGGEEYATVELGQDQYAFGQPDEEQVYPFVLKYYPEGTSSEPREHFVWEINVPVDITRRVSLTYTVELTDPQTEAGVYTKLYTNEEAILYPVDSYGNAGEGEYFERPALAYKVPPKDDEHTTGDIGLAVFAGALAVCAAMAFTIRKIKTRRE